MDDVYLQMKPTITVWLKVGGFLARFGSWQPGANPSITPTQASGGGLWLMPDLPLAPRPLHTSNVQAWTLCPPHCLHHSGVRVLVEDAVNHLCTRQTGLNLSRRLRLVPVWPWSLRGCCARFWCPFLLCSPPAFPAGMHQLQIFICWIVWFMTKDLQN